jgi:hypothetical protein
MGANSDYKGADTRADGAGGGVKAAAVLVPTAAALAVNLWYGPFLIDDMYIGLRYAANLAAGHGLVFNAGEPVMGISAPLCVILMGIGGALGFDLTKVGLFLSVVPLTGMVALMQLLAVRVLRPAAAIACGLAIVVFPTMPFTANSGMDTSISMAAVYGTFWALVARRYWWAGIASGVAVFNRPDGALVAAVALGYVFLRDRKEVYKIIVPTVLAVGPWLGYATWFYGSPIPHSIVAKQANHYTPPGEVAAKILLVMTLIGPVSVAAMAGIVQAVRRRSGLIVIPAWMGLYLAGLIWSRIDPFLFIWYLGPLAPGWILLAAYALQQGGDGLVDRWRQRRQGWAQAARLAPVAAILAAAVVFGSLDRPLEIFLKNIGYTRADRYLEIGGWLRERMKPGQKVMVGECGALSYALRGYYILDASGLNSPVIFRLCRIKDDPSDPRPRFNTMACDLKVIEDQSPDYIMIYSIFFRIDELSQVPWFRENYRRLDLGDPALLDYLVFEKITG